MSLLCRNTKTFFLFGRFFKIRKLETLDFLEGEGIPFSMFELVGAGKDAIQSMIKKLQTEDEKAKEKEIQKEIVIEVLELCVIYPRNFRPGSLKWQQAFILYCIILGFSIKRFRRLFNINKTTLLLIDALAKRYGVTPIEVFKPLKKDYTELEALMFNQFIGVNAISIEVDRELQARKSAKDMAARRK